MFAMLRAGAVVKRRTIASSLAFLVGCAAGCATSGPPGAETSEDTSEVSADDTDVYEAREEVLAAEARRKVAAFHERMSRLRADQAERAERREAEQRKSQAKRTQDMLTDLTGPGSLVTAASDARPAEARPRSAVEVPLPPSVVPAERSRRGAEEARAEEAGVPAAELLRAARCLLRQSSAALEADIREARRAGDSRVDVGAYALALMDVQGLQQDVSAALSREGLANGKSPCTNPPTGVRQALEALYGEAARQRMSPEAITRGQARLRRELELRAGLPIRK